MCSTGARVVIRVILFSSNFYRLFEVLNRSEESYLRQKQKDCIAKGYKRD